MKAPIKRVAITGGAGFIGSHLVDACLARGLDVTVVDNRSSGPNAAFDEQVKGGRVRLLEADILEPEPLREALADADLVFHLAANPDARRGLENPRLDLDLEVLTTFQVLEAMRLRPGPSGRLVFTSSGTVYGDVGTRAVTEAYGPCLPISIYGAGKAAAEAFVSAYCHSFGLQAVVCRLGNVIGERATHGALFDFVEKLKRDRTCLEVLGDGQQAKPYLYVRDLVEALLFLAQRAESPYAVYNVAPAGATSVAFLARALLQELGLHGTRLEFGRTPAGWTGDIPQSRLDAGKLARLGWTPRHTSDQAVEVAVRALVRDLGLRRYFAGS